MQRILSHRRYLNKRAVMWIIAAIFAMIGAYLLIAGHAQSPYIASEVEAGNQLSGAASQSDSTASGGKYVRFSDNFVIRNGTKLYLNGKQYQFTGINMYEATERDNCSSGYSDGYNDNKFDTDLTSFDTATSGKARVIRAWFFQSWATTNNTRDWSAFDHVLSVAATHGFKVIPVLANEWRECEAQTGAKTKATVNPRDTAWYQQGYKTQVDINGTVTYRAWIQEVATHYKNNPTVLAWQLMNEANVGMSSTAALGCPASTEQTAASAIGAWAADATSLIKAVDPNHLVSVGTLPNWCGTSGPNGSADFRDPDNVTVNSVTNNDLCDFHDYNFPDQALPEDLVPMITACNAMNKPILVSESGITFLHVNNDLIARSNLFNAKFPAQLTAGVGGITPWVWNGSGASVDSHYEIKPGDPTLQVISKYGTTP